MITIGIDPHKSSLTAVALQPSGDVSATIRLEVNRDTVTQLQAWAARWPQRQWAVEGAARLVAASRRAWPPQTNPSLMCPRNWPRGPDC